MRNRDLYISSFFPGNFRYAPIFPLILVNGASGVACGFNTFVPSYDVNNIIRNLERLMDNKATEEMIPSYRDFQVILISGLCGVCCIWGLSPFYLLNIMKRSSPAFSRKILISGDVALK
jgi:hypothetical protein